MLVLFDCLTDIILYFVLRVSFTFQQSVGSVPDALYCCSISMPNKYGLFLFCLFVFCCFIGFCWFGWFGCFSLGGCLFVFCCFIGFCWFGWFGCFSLGGCLFVVVVSLL